MRITAGAVSGALAIGPASCLNGALAVADDIAVAAGASLALNAGVVVKWAGGYRLDVSGTVVTDGTLLSPVVFTSYSDDAYAGDTNNNGPSAGTPGEWQALVFRSGSTGSVIRRTLVRYGGNYYGTAVLSRGAAVTLEDSRITASSLRGLDLVNITGSIAVRRCVFEGNSGTAVENVPIASVPGFVNNLASGNGADYMRVTLGNVPNGLSIGPENILHGSLVPADNISVSTGTTATLRPGTIVKWAGGYRADVHGSLNILGTAYEPVIFTALADDFCGGDTNGNGPSSGTPGAWQALLYPPDAEAAVVENLLLRYGGSYYGYSARFQSPLVSVRALRVEEVNGRGVLASSLSGNAVSWIATHCSNSGIRLEGGGFNIVHATSAANQGFGIENAGGFLGSVVNTLSWGNAAGNFTGFAPGTITFSDGAPNLAGSNGNVYVDPLFESLGATPPDLHLSAISPCLGLADPTTAYAAVKDFDENSRLLDHNLSGVPWPDMGAYERPVWRMSVSGIPRIGTEVIFTVAGPPAASIYALGILDGAVPLYPYGILLAGAVPGLSVVPLAIVEVGQPFALPISGDPGIVGLTGAVQTLTAPYANPSVGNLTALYRATVRL